MVNLSKRAIPFMLDLKKRAAREYALGFLTKDELDRFCKHQEEIEKIVKLSDQRHEGEQKDEGKRKHKKAKG